MTYIFICGLATTGKTTLAELLVKNEVYDYMIEMDTLHWWSVGEKHKIVTDFGRRRKNLFCQILLKGIQDKRDIVISGYWPWEDKENLFSITSNYKIIVLKRSWTQAKKVWLRRGGSLSDFKHYFIDSKNWYKIQEMLRKIAIDQFIKGHYVGPNFSQFLEHPTSDILHNCKLRRLTYTHAGVHYQTEQRDFIDVTKT